MINENAVQPAILVNQKYRVSEQEILYLQLVKKYNCFDYVPTM
jgi:hypothetical protein